MYSGLAAGRTRQARPSGEGTISERIPGESYRRDELRALLFERRWPEGFVCPAYGNGRSAPLKSRAHTYECLSCGRQTSITAGTGPNCR